MRRTPQWTLLNGKVPGADAYRETRALTMPSNKSRRIVPGQRVGGCGIGISTVLAKQDVGYEDSKDPRTIHDPAQFGFEVDPNIVWIQNPQICFTGDHYEQFSQVQAIIRDCLRRLGNDIDFAVVRAGPHKTQNRHDELGTVVRFTNAWTGRMQNAIEPADLHITLYAGRKQSKQPTLREELLLQGHIYLEKVWLEDAEDDDDFEYIALTDPAKRKYPKPGEEPACEEWYTTNNSHDGSAGPAPRLPLTRKGESATE